MKFSFQTWVILILLAGIVVLILFWRKLPEFGGIKNANDSIAKILEENQVNLMRARTFELRLAEHRLKSTIDSGRYLRELSTLRLKMLTKRTQVQLIIDTIPDLRQFVETSDNVIELQRQRIDTLEANIQFQAALYTDLIYLKNKEVTNLNLIITQKDLIIESQEKSLKKRSRGSKVLKVLAVTGAVGGILLGSQL